MTSETRHTHRLEYQQASGTWKPGILAYSLDEARGIARASEQRTGRKARIVTIGTGKIEQENR